MALQLKNLTSNDIELNSLGITVSANDLVVVGADFEPELELLIKITNGDLVFVSNGIQLSQTDSMNMASGDGYSNSQIDTKISDLLDSAPGTLDTLNELAAAIGDDENFATNITNQIATKAPIVHTHPLPNHAHDDVYYTETEVDNLLSQKSDTTHNHDDVYYTETEVDNLLSQKSDTTHNHDGVYYTQAQVDAAILAASNPFGSEFHVVNEHTVSTTSSTTWLSKAIITPNLVAGRTYRFAVTYMWNYNSTSQDFEAQLLMTVPGDSPTQYYHHKQEAKDSAGTFGATGSNQKFPVSYFDYITPSTNGAHTLDLQFRSSSNGIKASMWEARIELWRTQ